VTGPFREWLEALGDIFWIRPAVLVLLGITLGEAAVLTESSGVQHPLLLTAWIYSGGESGARALLGAVAASSIGVASTTFSITVAALSLASGQMGPRLLRNFVRDAGNQCALGIFLGTFAYALVVLRTVRAVEEMPFVPHLGVTGALILALLCVATLIWFVHHVATGINVETVIDLVNRDLSGAIDRLSLDQPPQSPPLPAPSGAPVTLDKRGYLRAVNEEMLAEWAARESAVLVLLVRPGDYLFPGAPVAEVGDGLSSSAKMVISKAFSLGPKQAAAQDLEFAVRQLVEVAVRALSPGINDPFTAIAVVDRLGATLCELPQRYLPLPTVIRDGQVVLYRPVTDYAGLCDAMFNMVRQSAAGSPAVLIRILETLGRVLTAENRPERRAELLRHATLVLETGRRTIQDTADITDLQARFTVLPKS
jgi:uncharacterized membrane protein